MYSNNTYSNHNTIIDMNIVFAFDSNMNMNLLIGFFPTIYRDYL